MSSVRGLIFTKIALGVRTLFHGFLDLVGQNLFPLLPVVFNSVLNSKTSVRTKYVSVK